MKTEQLFLPLQLSANQSWAKFYPGANPELAAILQRAVTESAVYQQYYLWGRAGVGKTHILQAVCHHGIAHDKTVFYLSLADHQNWQPEIVNGLDKYQVVCLDDIDAIFDQTDWEQALFGLYNQLAETECLLVLAAQSLPVACSLPDLASRLLAGAVYQVKAPSDSELPNFIAHVAAQFGLSLSPEVNRYLLYRAPREPAVLYQCLSNIHQASLQQKRRVTVPLVKEVLAL